MEYRKLIGFGQSSHVVSLPKKWLKKYNIEKGDTLNLKIEGDCLLFRPDTIKKKEVKTYIEAHENIEVLKKRLLTAYVNNADIIVIKNPTPKTKDLFKNFVALEIISETKKEIVARSFLNLEKVNYHNLMKKVDHIITEMFIETNISILKYLQEDVNRLCYLIFRAIKSLQSSELIKYWNCTYFLRELGDILKTTESIMLEEQIVYKQAMKAFYDINTELVCKINDELIQIKNKELRYLIKNLNIS